MNDFEHANKMCFSEKWLFTFSLNIFVWYFKRNRCSLKVIMTKVLAKSVTLFIFQIKIINYWAD